MTRFLNLFVYPLVSLVLSCTPQSNKMEVSVEFDSSGAFMHLKNIVAIGPKESGSDGARMTAEYIRDSLVAEGLDVECDKWEEDTPSGKKTFRNIITEIKVQQGNKKFILLGAHYDTKKLQTCPDFQGANDGASGAALLITAASEIMKIKSSLGENILFVFFDGEECIYSYGEKDGLHGSKRLVRRLKKEGRLRHCSAVVIVDMLADKDLNAGIPAGCDQKLAGKFFESTSKSNTAGYFRSYSFDIIDDHTPFLREGVPAIDIIDFEYGTNNVFWHSSGDSLENVSEKSLAISGLAIMHFLAEMASK